MNKWNTQVIVKGRLVHFDVFSDAPIEVARETWKGYYHLKSDYEYYVDGKKETSNIILHFFIKP